MVSVVSLSVFLLQAFIFSAKRITHNDLFQANRRSLIPLPKRAWHRGIGVTLGYKVTNAVGFFLCYEVYLLCSLRPRIATAQSSPVAGLENLSSV